MNELLSEEKKVPRTLLEARKVAESATYEQSKTVPNCVVIYGQFVYSIYSLMEIYVVCSAIQIEKQSIKSSSSKIQTGNLKSHVDVGDIYLVWRCGSLSSFTQNNMSLLKHCLCDNLLSFLICKCFF